MRQLETADEVSEFARKPTDGVFPHDTRFVTIHQLVDLYEARYNEPIKYHTVRSNLVHGRLPAAKLAGRLVVLSRDVHYVLELLRTRRRWARCQG